jgi:hypothetical protein
LVLPVNDSRELSAASDVLERLRNIFGGVTHSITAPHVYTGWWQDGESFDEDKVSISIVDCPLSDDELAEYTRDLRSLLLVTYREYRCYQKAVWVTAHNLIGNPIEMSKAKDWGITPLR